MFTTCLHCLGALGANDELESFPVGKRLAFDATKGRLWVVCPKCSRWNLSPLEERWEAVERAESMFGETPTRAHTGEIGLAVRRSGLELIRIGRPLRPEFAAWRYGRHLRSRFQRAWFARGVDAADEEGIFEAAGWAAVIGIPVLAAIAFPFIVAKGWRDARRDGRVLRNVAANGRALNLSGRELRRVRFVADRQRRWRLELPQEPRWVVVYEDDVPNVLARILPHLNEVGASERQLGSAIAKVEHFREVDRLLDYLAARPEARSQPFSNAAGYAQRLALEIMTHEASERRALEGELAALHAEWKEAERIAAIADNLLLPERIRRLFRPG